MTDLSIVAYMNQINTLEKLAIAANVEDIYNEAPLNLVWAIKSCMEDGEFSESDYCALDCSLIIRQNRWRERYLLGMSVNYPDLVQCTCCLDLHHSYIRSIDALMDRIYNDYELYKYHSMIA